ncbi:MAG: hypothetical protein RTU30_07540 [Candidatus Thorarchaeota archaeon]
MFRTIMALLVALLAAVLIGAFQIVGVTTDMILALPEGDILAQLTLWGQALFLTLVRPYTALTAGGAFAPLIALGVGGFIAGLISKSGIRMLFVSLIAVAIFFVGYVVLSMGMPLALESFTDQALDIAIDLGVSFALLFVPGIIGASLTAEEY